MRVEKCSIRARHALLIIAFVFTIPFASLWAQGQLAVPLDHPVYRIIESAELNGTVARVSSVKPYTRSQVAEFLASIQAGMDRFSPAERGMIAAFAREFTAGYGDRPLWVSPEGKARAGVGTDAAIKAGVGTGLGQAKDLWQLASHVTPYLAGSPAPWISFKGEAGFTIDKIEKGLYLPYAFTKEWDAWHIDFSDVRYSTGEKDYPSFSYDLRQDIAAATDSNSLIVRMSRFRRDWGTGSGSLSLSGTARPFVGIEAQFRPSRFFAISHVTGSLANWQKMENERRSDEYLADPSKPEENKISWQKMLAVQKMELFPSDWLTLSATATMVGAKRLELGYMSPFIFMVMYQNHLADVDNLAVQVDASVQLPRLGKLYGSFYADEMELTNLSQLFTRPRNMFALQAGLRIPLPVLPFAMASAQYTKIEPFVYSHYPTWYPDYRMKVDASWSHDGENLGYHLPPNSDEFLLQFDAMPAADFRFRLRYSLVRHGDNPSYTPEGAPLISGDIDHWMNYGNIDKYPDKNFLHDGLYDYNHILRIDGYWRPSAWKIPAEIGAGVGFCHTWWEANNSGEPEPAPSTKFVLDLSVKLFM